MESNPSDDLLSSENAFMDFTISLGDVSVQQGQQVCIPVTVTNFTDILGMQFNVDFDPTQLQFDNEVLSNPVALPGLASNAFGPANNGSFTFLWVEPSVTNGATVPDGTVIFELCFTALVDDVTSTISLSRDEITDSAQNQLPLTVETSTVTVGSGNGGGNNGSGNSGDFTISLGDVSAQQGQEVCIPVTVTNFTDILGMQFNINFDETELQFNGATIPNPAPIPGLASNAFGPANNGSLTFLWVEPTVTNGATVADGTMIYELCFTPLVDDVTSEIFLSNDEITDSGQNQLTLNVETSTVTVGTGSNNGGGNTGDFTLSLADVSVQQGQQVCIPVTTSNFTDILGMQFNINFNDSELRFDNAIIPDPVNIPGLASNAFGPANNGSLTFLWVEPTVTNGATVPDGTLLFELCFTALTSGATSEITLSNDEITDSGQNQLTLTVESSTVTVGTGNNGGNDNFEVIMPNATVDQGEEFCLGVTVNDFTNLSGLELDIIYDANSLDFTEIKNLNLVDLTTSSFGLPGQGANQPGAIALSWVGMGANDVTLPNGTVIFETCFQATNSATTSQVSFSGLEASQGLNLVSASSTPGTVTIDQTNTSDFTFVVGNVSAQAGGSVCVPLRVNNFDDIAGLEFTLAYDPAILEFDELRDFGLDGLNASSFGTPGQGANQPGAIKASWFDQTGNGADLADGSTIVSACFTVIGSGNTIVEVSNSELLEVTDNSNNQIPVVLESGTVSIDGIAPTTDLQFIFSSPNVQQNDEVCVALSVNNFDEVLGMQFVMTYDPTVLMYESVKNITLDQLNASSFGEPGVGNNQPGSIILSWFDQTVAGVTVPDGTALFELCFTAIPESGNSTVTISNSEAIEVIDVDEDEIPNQIVPGVVSITTGPPLVQSSPAIITDVNCNGGNDGAIDISIAGGSGSYAYVWDFQNAITEDLDNLPAGSYTVTVTDNTTAQTLIETFTVSEPATAVSIDNPTAVNISCFGESTGSIQITASGGTGALSYTWNAGLAATASQSNLPAGTYEVTVADVNLCTDTRTIILTEPAAALAVDDNTTLATCSGIADGSITLIASGGTGPYSYNWGNGLTGDVAVQNNLDAGDYPVTITDANNCTLTTSIQVGSNPAVVINSLDAGFITNGNDGTASLSVSGGTAPLTFQWTGPGGFTADTEDLTGLSTPGEYCVTVSDASGCFDERCIMVLEQLAFDEINISNTCANSSTGSIDIAITGGMAPYTYNWDNNATTEDIDNLAAGDYAVTVTDALGNNFSGQFPVGENSLIFVLGDVNNVTGTETNNNGSVTLNPAGGTPGYSYRWSNGATTSSISNLTAGEYCVTVTDQLGCTSEACFDVEVMLLPLAFSTEKVDVLCNGESTGTASIEITGGAAPYGVSFSDNIQLSTADGIVQRSNLPAGELVFVITDATNATITGSVMIEETLPITVSNLTIVHDSEAAGCTGQISLELTGGTPGYAVQWNSPNTGLNIIGLCAGTYVPNVQDASGCSTPLDPIVVNTFSVGETVANVECVGDQNGSIKLNISGGSGQNTYNWQDANGVTITGQDSIGDLTAGRYSVTVTESSGNTITKTIDVGTQSSLAATVAIDSDYRGFGVSCFDATDGSLSVNASNGMGQLVYSWMQGDNSVGEGASISNLGIGDYTVEVMDEAGCLVQESISLQAPAPIEVSGFITDPSCVGERNGSITVVATGGTGNFSYAWSNQIAAPTVNSLIQGRYTVTVSDANNCQMEEGFDLQDPAPIQVLVETTPATDGCNGVASAVVSGGTGPYLYRWNSNAGNADAELTNLCPGDYAVVVTDARGCTASPELVQAEVLDRRFPCMDVRSVISPDGDGLNDEFFINCIEEMSDNRLMIFNRIGQLVFEADNYENNWMGTTMNGDQLPEGAYYYVLEFTDMDGNFVQSKGSITLLRQE
ncbi:MAG: hypothetical protein Sapg2KO_45820 [Saprospiraceae bacterium]